KEVEKVGAMRPRPPRRPIAMCRLGRTVRPRNPAPGDLRPAPSAVRRAPRCDDPRLDISDAQTETDDDAPQAAAQRCQRARMTATADRRSLTPAGPVPLYSRLEWLRARRPVCLGDG